MTVSDPSNASADREALLALLLAEEGIEVTSSAIGFRDPDQPAVLSYAQERMWFLDQFEEDTAALGVRTAVALHGPLDVPVLRRCLDEIARRHDVLRTVIVGDAGRPRPVVLPVAPMPVVEHDVHGDLGELARILEREAARTFDLAHEPPVLVTIVRVGDDHHVLSVVMHHIASDGWSFAVFFRELAALYGTLREGRPSPLPELAIQYEDYAWWQRHGASEAFERQLDYWRRQLAGPLPAFEIPTDHRRPSRHTFAGAQVQVRPPEHAPRPPRGPRQVLRGDAVHDDARCVRGRRRPPRRPARGRHRHPGRRAGAPRAGADDRRVPEHARHPRRPRRRPVVPDPAGAGARRPASTRSTTRTCRSSCSSPTSSRPAT